MTSPPWPPQAIKLFILDVDGTLTNGGIYYGPDGEALKRFDVRDGQGLVAVQRIGVEVILISGDDSPIVRTRTKKLGIRAAYLGCLDKAEVVRSLMAERDLAPNAVLFMGDDTNDLAAMKEVGHTAAPADAVGTVIESVDYVTQAQAGHGAVREVCDLFERVLASGR